jgi:hypothetical protein
VRWNDGHFRSRYMPTRISFYSSILIYEAFSTALVCTVAGDEIIMNGGLILFAPFKALVFCRAEKNMKIMLGKSLSGHRT